MPAPPTSPCETAPPANDAALRESERRFRQLAESIREVFWITSADGRQMVYVSPAYETIWGRSCQSLYDNPGNWLEAIHPEDRPRVEQAFFAKAGRGEFDEEYRILRPDGSVRWIRDRGFPVHDESGQVYRIAGVADDITPHQLAEQSLRDSEALYHSLVEHLPLHLIRKDLQGHFTFVNGSVCALLGKPLDEVVGKTDFDFYPADLAAKYRRDDQKVIETGKTFEDVEEHVTADRGRIFVQILKAPVFDAQRRTIGTQVLFWDVTARKRAEDDLKRTAEELARSNQELEQFAYIASHDLQEPLRMVTSYLQLLERRYRGQLDADAAEFIGFAVDGARRMQNLVNDLLSYARVGTRGKPFVPASCEKAFAEAAANLKAAIDAKEATVTHDALPTVQADPTQLVQLFQNLIGNSIKFHGPEPPRVHVAARREGGEWVLAVRDNGIGIEPRHAERVFGIFQRLHAQADYPGTGIGLAICKRIVERHGGRIWVESEPGQGCVFCFTVPAGQGER